MMILKEPILDQYTLRGCDGLEITDLGQHSEGKGVVVLKWLILGNSDWKCMVGLWSGSNDAVLPASEMTLGYWYLQQHCGISSNASARNDAKTPMLARTLWHDAGNYIVTTVTMPQHRHWPWNNAARKDAVIWAMMPWCGHWHWLYGTNINNNNAMMPVTMLWQRQWVTLWL